MMAAIIPTSGVKKVIGIVEKLGLTAHPYGVYVISTGQETDDTSTNINIEDVLKASSIAEITIIPEFVDPCENLHVFKKIIYIKKLREKIKNIAKKHNNQNKSLLKQHNIKQQPILYRKHGVDNRR